MPIAFDHTTLGQRILFGTGRALELASTAIESLDAHRVLLIAGGSARELSAAIASGAPVVARVEEVVQHVPVERVRTATELARAHSADAIVAIGGGSSTGLAKAVARETGLPIVAVPTTFAGSEATSVWGQTEGARKTTGTDDRVLPKVVVYDASLSRSLPGHLAVASGLNAVAHAVDGFWAPRRDPINAALGTEGLHSLIPALRALNEEPDDIEAREQALYGAYLAAVAFASAGSGMHHKICHVLGGAYSLSHAEMHAIVLPYVTAFNQPAAPDAAARVAAALGTSGSAAAGLHKLREDLGIARSLRELGLREEDIGEAARLATEAIPASNPRPFSVSDVEAIIRAAWDGAPITE